MNSPKIETVKVSPELAEDWLAKNTANRPVKRLHVAHLAGVITRGEWKLNGETIIFGEDGVLLDGQHRLAAIIEAGMPIETLVVWNVDPAGRETLDTGVKRTLADVLAMQGEVDAKILAGALGYLYRAINGQQLSVGGRARMSHHQARQLLEDHPNIKNSMTYGRRVNAVLRVSPSLVTYLHYAFASIKSDDDDALIDADAFMEQTISGADLSEGAPILALRRFCERENLAPRRMSNARIQALWIKAWNAWRDGQDVQQLRFRSGGSRPESFPEPH